MGEADIKYLKVKCNKLIDKALQLEKEITKKDALIKQLQKKKKLLEKRINEDLEKKKQEKENEEFEQENLSVLQEEETKPNAEISVHDVGQNFDVTYSKIFEMIQSISTQMDNRPREEIVIRKVSTGGKILELLADGAGKLFKLIIIGGLIGLVSLAATILLNGELRNMVIDFVKSCIG